MVRKIFQSPRRKSSASTIFIGFNSLRFGGSRSFRLEIALLPEAREISRDSVGTL